MARKHAYDVAVVGGGAAGCVVAARLAESPSRSVLLLEAGPDRRADLPPELRNGWTIEREPFDWGFQSEPLFGKPRPVRRKRLLGGTSWLTRFSPRGSPADYDGWEQLGNPGWNFESVLPYFVRLESDMDFGEEPWHGNSGPMPSTRYLDLDHTPVCEAAVQALPSAGIPLIDDHNKPGAVGGGRMPMNTLNAERVTTVDAYLPLGRTPANLTIRAGSQVDRVVFDSNRQARGVRLVDGTTVEAGSVVLSAGVYGTPTILMRSGVGPAPHVRELDIPLIAELTGVGANLADHPAVYIDYGYAGTGRRAPVLSTIATFHSASRATSDTPDLMFWLHDPTDDDPTFGAEVVLLRPRSRGRVRLRSANPADPPVIELPSLSEGSDIERLAEGCRRAVELGNDARVRRLCTGPAPVDAADFDAWSRAEAYSIPHVVGTCAMGPRPGEGAVVDVSGRVHGTARLSVVDASIMPDVPSGFIHFPVIMLAERLSEVIASQT